MKVFIPLLCLASLVLAEPPVGNGYPGARSSHDNHHDHGHENHEHHTSDHERSLSQEYGPPSDTLESARSAPSDGYEYNAPNSRSSPNAREQSRFPPATVRVSFNQRFSSAATRDSKNAARSRPQDLSAPSTRSGISQEYGAPIFRSLSQDYGAPSAVSGRTIPTEYGVPNTRSPSEEYGAPAVAARSNQKSSSSSNFRGAANTLSQDYSAPASRSQTNPGSHGYSDSLVRSNQIYQGYDAPKSAFSSRNDPSSTYGAPARSLSTLYSAPSTRNSNTQGYNSVSQTYSAPQKPLSETYGAPNARSLSQEYGVPSSRSSNTEAEASSYPSASSRSSPSSTYLPAAGDATPSQQYGVPEQDSQGYESARARALNELLNQEPASYDFGYQIEDQESGSDFGHSETREENRAEGSYFVVLPDGTKQTVEYEADERGFRPRISVEDVAASVRAGYDENAQALARSAGPY